MDGFDLSAWQYELPRERIAQHPAESRGGSRLMSLRRFVGAPDFAVFADLPRLLPPGALLVANNSRVAPARLVGHRQNGARAEFLMLTPLPFAAAQGAPARVEGLVKPAARIRPGDCLSFGAISVRIISKGDYGRCEAEIAWSGSLEQELLKYGRLPLPPYIKRSASDEDGSRYQTVYAREPGSVAAPTAGLHFTEAMRGSLARAGFGWVEITLHVGYGTFSPVRCADIRSHKMHAEHVEISAEAAARINQARAEGRPVIAVGTTSVRALEGAYARLGSIGAFAGMVDIFLYPGKKIHVVDGLLTNFHLPGSTLLMLVAAFSSRESILDAYAQALRQGFRFFSYGDAMLLLP